MESEPLLRWFEYVGVGGALLLTIVFLPKRVRLFAGRFLPPNWMSVIHTPLAWLGYFWLYKQGHFFGALLMLSVSGGLDLADGRVARAYDELVGEKLSDLKFWTQMNHRGVTPLGKILDPLTDKLTVTPIFLEVCWTFLTRTETIRHDGILWLLYFGVGLILLMLLTDFCGQLIRLDYFRKWRQKTDNGATWAGKYKALGQWIWLMLYPIWDQGWLPEAITYCLLFLNIMLVTILVLAALSVLSKIRPLMETWTTNLLS